MNQHYSDKLSGLSNPLRQPDMYQYLSRLADTVLNRQDVIVELLEYDYLSPSRGQISGRLRFYNGSTLLFSELAHKTGHSIRKIEYRYHYQGNDGSLIFRYDSSPHHPEISTFPHHKHIGDKILPAGPPDLGEVLREIDTMIYPK